MPADSFYTQNYCKYFAYCLDMGGTLLTGCEEQYRNLTGGWTKLRN